MLGECPGLFSRQDELAEEACAIADVIVLVILGQIEDVLTQKLSLLAVGNT